MPGRLTPLITNNFYHIFNKGVASRTIFENQFDYQRAQNSLLYYRYQQPPIKFSRLKNLPSSDRADLLKQLEKEEKQVNLIAFCLMPNHFHLLLKQNIDNGISKYLSNFSNSYTRYFNTKNERLGPLFLGKFKAVLIKNNDQLLHVSRYIHLNPYSAGIIKNKQEILKYPYSSLNLNSTSKVESQIIEEQFKNFKTYHQFILDQADYQKNLQLIKNQILE